MRRALFVFAVLALVGCGDVAPTAIPFTRLTGADWLALPRALQDDYTKQALNLYRCPSTVNENDTALSVGQAASTTTGRSQKVTALFRTLMALDGCVPAS